VLHDSEDVTSTSRAGSGPPYGAGLVEIFLLFSQLGLSSFGGGVSAWMHRAFVEQRGWFSETEFAAVMALARIMPGANVINLAVLIGQRARGAAGAAAAALGLLVGPSLGVVALALVYHRLAGNEMVHAALDGITASAVGLLFAMALHAGRDMVRPKGRAAHPVHAALGSIAVAAATFLSIGILRWPTVPTVMCLMPFSVALAFSAARRRGGETHGSR
jgi:chromate transporter